MAWQTPKTDWLAGDGVANTDLNRIEGNTAELKVRTDNADTVRTIRKVVGTSMAGWTTKDCDYLCDGTNDQSEISSAISALSSTGGEIILLDGVYNIQATFSINYANITLRGNGPSTTLRYSSSTIYVTAANCSIRDLWIIGQEAGTSSKDITAIYVTAADCTIHNVTMIRCATSIITGASAANLTVSYCTILCPYTDFTSISYDFIGISSVNSGTIINNTIKISGIAIDVYGQFRVHNNNIFISAPDTFSRYTAFLQVRSASEYPTTIGLFTGNTCKSAVLGASAYYALWMRTSTAPDITIADNIISSDTNVASSCGILLQGIPVRMAILNNIITNFAAGIKTTGTPSSIISAAGNVLVDNVTGIELTNNGSTLISGNTISKSASYGSSEYSIRISGTGKGLVSSNLILGKDADVVSSVTKVNNKWQ